jgi:hypothetical protein
VADDVVQLSRDPRALLRDGSACSFLALPFGPGSSLLGLVRLLELAAESERDRPDEDEDDAGGDEAVEVPDRVAVGGKRGHTDREHEPRHRLPTLREQSHQEDRRASRQEGDEEVVDEPFVDERRQDDRDADRHRRPEREAPSEKERADDRHGREHVEPEWALGAVRLVLSEHDTGEAEADGGKEQHVEPVAARESPKAVHNPKVLQNGSYRLIPETDLELVREDDDEPSARTRRNRPRARWQARSSAVRSIAC